MITGNCPRRRNSFNTSRPLDAPRLMSSTTRSGSRSSYSRSADHASCAAIGSSPARFSANASRSISSRSSSTSRIRTASPGHRQGEPHPRTRAHLRVDADTAAVCLDNALGNGQPQADAGRFGFRSHTIETLEQTCLLLARDAIPLIFDRDVHDVIVGSGNNADYRLFGTVL